MMWQDFVAALALVLVFEGFLPFLSPSNWRKMMLNMIAQHDSVLRIIGFVCMVAGATLLTVMHHYFY